MNSRTLLGGVSDFLFICFQGAFGEVFKVVHKHTGEIRAVKMIKRDRVNRAEILQQLQENEFKVLMETVKSFFNF